MDFIVKQCDYGQDPPMVQLIGPLGIGISFPISDYDRVRGVLAAQGIVIPADLVCPA